MTFTSYITHTDAQVGLNEQLKSLIHNSYIHSIKVM